MLEPVYRVTTFLKDQGLHDYLEQKAVEPEWSKSRVVREALREFRDRHPLHARRPASDQSS